VESAELIAILREVRERVRARNPETSAGAEIALPDLLPLVHARDAAMGKMAAIGTVNPRSGGLVNAVVQGWKRLVARVLDWHVREQVEFNRKIVACVDAVLETERETNRALSAMGARLAEQMAAMGARLGEQEKLGEEMRDMRTHWAAWRVEWERKLAQNEMQFLRSVADLQGGFQHRVTLMEASHRDSMRGQNADFHAALERHAFDIQKRLWADLEKMRTEVERIIHAELRMIRQRARIAAELPAAAAAVSTVPAPTGAQSAVSAAAAATPTAPAPASAQPAVSAPAAVPTAPTTAGAQSAVTAAAAATPTAPAPASAQPAVSAAAAATPTAAAAAPPDAAEAVPPLAFDYARFAERFRGSEDYVEAGQQIYRPYFEGCRKVLDIGCGRGEFLKTMRDAGIPAQGIELSAECVAACRLEGLNAETADVFPYLAAIPEGWFDGIFCSQVVEHLPPERLPELIRACASRLAPNGVIAIETPNPECLAIFATHFYLDPTHTRPVPHPLLIFYLEEFGVGNIEVLRLAPARDSMPALNALPEEFRDAFFGALDYAVIGRKL
jgi:O-antigen chain-terminating methyltransferase